MIRDLVDNIAEAGRRTRLNRQKSPRLLSSPAPRGAGKVIRHNPVRSFRLDHAEQPRTILLYVSLPVPA